MSFTTQTQKSTVGSCSSAHFTSKSMPVETGEEIKMVECNSGVEQDVLGQNSELLKKSSDLGEHLLSKKNRQRGWHQHSYSKEPISYLQSSHLQHRLVSVQLWLFISHCYSRLHKNGDFIQQATECSWRSEWNKSHYTFLMEFAVLQWSLYFLFRKSYQVHTFCVLRVFLTFQWGLISYQLCILHHLLF